MSSHIRDTRTDTASELTFGETEYLKEKIDSMSEARKAMKEENSLRTENADSHVKTNPFLYAAIARRIGFALGKLQGHGLKE